jgi:hypothetical protein
MQGVIIAFIAHITNRFLKKIKIMLKMNYNNTGDNTKSSLVIITFWEQLNECYILDFKYYQNDNYNNKVDRISLVLLILENFPR